MAKIKSDKRQRKTRSSSPIEEAPAKWGLPLLIFACVILFLDMISISDDSSSPQGQRRSLLNLDDNKEDQVLDTGVEENVWARQLRARKGTQKKDNNNEGSSRSLSMSTAIKAGSGAEENRKGGVRSSMAAAIEAGEDNYATTDGTGRKMSVIPGGAVPSYIDKHHFDECIGVSIEECQTLVDTYVTEHTEDFNNQTTLMLDVRKIRELTDASYYKVVLRTNVEADAIYGIFDDGMVYYPWEWRVEGEDTTIGPWSCKDGETHLTPADCCRIIQTDVALADDAGNFMACFVEEPVGGPNNPEREDRAIAVINAEGKVVRAPVAH